MKKRLIPLLLVVLLLVGCSADPKSAVTESDLTEPNIGVQTGYDGYTLVVTAWDTPTAVLEELNQQGIAYTEYYDGALLLREETAALGQTASVYLCEGTYEVDEGDFIQTDGTVKLTVLGAGQGKTRILAQNGLRQNRGVAIHITGDGGSTVTVRDLTIEGFQVGVKVKNASNVVLEDLLLRENHFAGVELEGARGCAINRCTFEENGAPCAGDTGFGLVLDAQSGENTGEENIYTNNGNQNAVDCPSLWDGYTDNDNSIALECSYTLSTEMPVLVDPAIEAQNARPGPNALRYELENAGYGDGVEEATAGEMPAASDGKYVKLLSGTLTLRIDVPEAGYYRLFVVGGSYDGNSKCDRVSVNDGPEYFTSYPASGAYEWQLSQPGLERWTNNVLTPQAPAEGFVFQKGENVITITANWGYCAYDCVYLEPIGESGGN